MQAKAGGALAVGTVAIAITYASSVYHTAVPSDSARAKSPAAAATSASAASGSKRPSFEAVTVYYATDRAVDTSSRSARQRDLCLAGIACGLGLAAFSVWFAQFGRRKSAIATGIGAGAVAIVVVASLPGWLARRGISESYVSGYRYGGDRGSLQMGYCEVTIPNIHRTGEVEAPSILRLELSARPDRHVMLQRTVTQSRRDFYHGVRERVQQSPQHDLFVFVHGFNVTFEAAARRTAQIAYDLEYQGAPIFFSWPSQGKAWRYTVDETNVSWAVPHLKQFLTELAAHSDAQAINLVAHSMGNRALTQAIYELGYEFRQDGHLFQQVVLAAPDIDADVFRDQIAPALARHSSRVTLYASANDDALAASKLVHGSRRAGESTSNPLTVLGIETVDVAMAELGPLGHSYYGSCPLILHDLAAILREERPASQRPWLATVKNHGATYWKLTDAQSVASKPAPSSRAR